MAGRYGKGMSRASDVAERNAGVSRLGSQYEQASSALSKTAKAYKKNRSTLESTSQNPFGSNEDNAAVRAKREKLWQKNNSYIDTMDKTSKRKQALKKALERYSK